MEVEVLELTRDHSGRKLAGDHGSVVLARFDLRLDDALICGMQLVKCAGGYDIVPPLFRNEYGDWESALFLLGRDKSLLKRIEAAVDEAWNRDEMSRVSFMQEFCNLPLLFSVPGNSTIH